MFRSAGLRFFSVGILVLLMFIPLNLVSGVVKERARYSEATVASISQEWGGPQVVSGPMLVIPVSEEVTYDRKREAVDDVTGLTLRDAKNNIIYERYQETKIEDRSPVFLFPETFDLDVATATQERKRGIFVVPVYTSNAEMSFNFNVKAAETVLRGEEKLLWNSAEMRLSLSENRALRGEAILTVDGEEFSLEPVASIGQNGRSGVYSPLGDPRKLDAYSLRLSLNGAQSFSAAAVGRTTRFSLTSDWPDPSFSGSFLPDASDITEKGFTARWVVPHLARALPQAARENPDHAARTSATMGVNFITPNDFYQKAWRSARYGILFIALTFLTILLLDRASERPAHPVQYLMVGLVQAVFVLLMLSYAEQVGFGLAYFLASGATIGLLSVFGWAALKLGKRTGLLTGMLIVVYGVLYLILQSADYALLAGSTLAFVALAGTMLLTRNEDWHGPEISSAPRWFARKARPETSAN